MGLNTKRNKAAAAQKSAMATFVHDSVEKLRLKLLDLTSRNPLLAYKHRTGAALHPRY